MKEQLTMLSLSLSSSSFIIIIFFFSLQHTTSLPSHAKLSSCHNTTFNCGTITNLSYPFTGGDRPSFCGLPQFHLSCHDDIPELTISSVSYRVLQINSTYRSLTLARQDLWNQTCTQHYVNSSFDPTTSFSYGSGNRNLTLFYGCKPTSAINKTLENLFHCESYGYKNNSYSVVGPFPFDPVFSLVECDVAVGVPILVEQANRLVENRTLLREVLMKGFHVNYSNPFENDCIECSGFGGECGFDSDENEPICICGNGLCPSPEKGSSNVGIAIGAAAGGVAVLVGILAFGCFVVRRRRRNAENSRSKELFMPTSSSDTLTSMISGKMKLFHIYF